MRKPFVWALMAILAVAGSAFAGTGIVANASFPTGSPATTNNDDSCDIGVAPAATLLLPYFEVDLTNPLGETTLFTITNVSQIPQIAHVTVWTDRSFPVLDFNIFLTGYDVQSINMFDIVSRGRIAEPGTTSDEGENPPGDRSLDNDANPVISAAGLSPCENLAVRIQPGLLLDLQNALTKGTYGACTRVGNVHTNAIGYVTVDVSRACSTFLPYDATYYTSDFGIAFDNTLIGDFQQVNSTQNFAQGNPMVHIRAVPEGGISGEFDTNFDRTFYSRYQDGATDDRRQPLPSTFAARWIEGGSTGFETFYKIWREGVTGDVADGDSCTSSSSGYVVNGSLAVTELVRFDEAENPTTFTPDEIISPAPEGEVALPETSRTDVSGDIYPPNDGAVAGWMYLNLDNGTPEDAPDPDVASQNWVIVSMRADGRYSVDFDAAWLGNGCSPVAPVTDADGDDPAIGPAADITPDF
jgi:hypothetical protein